MLNIKKNICILFKKLKYIKKVKFKLVQKKSRDKKQLIVL